MGQSRSVRWFGHDIYCRSIEAQDRHKRSPRVISGWLLRICRQAIVRRITRYRYLTSPARIRLFRAGRFRLTGPSANITRSLSAPDTRYCAARVQRQPAGITVVHPSDFSNLALAPGLFENLANLGYEAVTPIQALSLPPILAGKDVIAQGEAGSGKTAAFGLGLLTKLDPKVFRVQALVLCPTRELADQVANEIRALARSIPNIKVISLCGGSPLRTQVSSLEHGVHVVVGTPGRIEDHLQRGSLRLEAMRILVLDEADRMLDMGFYDAIDGIVEKVPRNRQTLLFSATYPPQIRSIAQRIMVDPEMAKVDVVRENASTEQHFYKVGDDRQRLDALRLILQYYRPGSTLIFCNTIKATSEPIAKLIFLVLQSLALHGDLEQRERDQTMIRFANKSVSVLVATDVAARGLDIDALDAVINYQIARDADVHLQRIGRTGRAGSKGQAFALCSAEELSRLVLITGNVEPSLAAEALPPVQVLEKPVMKPAYATLQIDGGKKQKLRAGDILGALTGENGIAGNTVGKIHITNNSAYVAVKRAVIAPAQRKLAEGRLKGRSFRVRQFGD